MKNCFTAGLYCERTDKGLSCFYISEKNPKNNQLEYRIPGGTNKVQNHPDLAVFEAIESFFKRLNQKVPFEYSMIQDIRIFVRKYVQEKKILYQHIILNDESWTLIESFFRKVGCFPVNFEIISELTQQTSSIHIPYNVHTKLFFLVYKIHGKPRYLKNGFNLLDPDIVNVGRMNMNHLLKKICPSHYQPLKILIKKLEKKRPYLFH